MSPPTPDDTARMKSIRLYPDDPNSPMVEVDTREMTEAEVREMLTWAAAMHRTGAGLLKLSPPSGGAS